MPLMSAGHNISLLTPDEHLEWLWREDFHANAASTPTTPDYAAPGPGRWQYLDGGTKLSKSAGRLQWSGNNASCDPSVIGEVLVARKAGRAVVGTITSGNNSSIDQIGWISSVTLTGVAIGAARQATIAFNATTLSLVLNGGSPYAITAGAVTSATEYQYAIVQGALGFHFYIKGGAFTDWNLLFVDNVNSSASMTPAITVLANFAGSSETLRVIDLGDPLNVDYASALINVTTDATSVGSELLANAGFTSWTADNPNSWTLTGESGADPAVSQSDPTGIVGTGAAKWTNTTAGSFSPAITQAVLTTGHIYEVGLNITQRTSGTLNVGDGVGGLGGTLYSTSGVKRQIGRALSANFSINKQGDTIQSEVIDDATVKELTLPTAVLAAADSLMYLEYTIPVSPVAGQRASILYRINAAGDEYNNCYEAKVQRNDANSAWDAALSIFASGGPTVGISTTGVGDTLALCVVAIGSNHDLYVRTSTGWSKQGSTYSNANYATMSRTNFARSVGFTITAFRIWGRTSTAVSTQLNKAIR